MLSIQPPISKSSSAPSIPKLTPNILPCRINHSGPVNASKRYWNVEDDEKGRKMAYFRGRKLLGREVKLSDSYRGAVICDTDRVLPLSDSPNASDFDAKAPTTAKSTVEDDEGEGGDDGEDDIEPTKVLEEVATFDEILVWGHEQVPGEDDVFVRGVQEWLGFAEAMHSVGEKTTAVAPATP
ncbi:hypothetical protein MMC26_007077 [Xylographa opegraphella]|nr:hypothetical protein [Xylographa opegraphella]